MAGILTKLKSALARHPLALLLPLLIVASIVAVKVYADEIPVEHMREVLLTIEVRKALLDDPVAGPLNLGVKVDGRVATLWGPVPSNDAKQRAEAVLRKFPYVTEVRNQLRLRVEEPINPASIGHDTWLKNTPPPAPRDQRETPAAGAPINLSAHDGAVIPATAQQDVVRLNTSAGPNANAAYTTHSPTRTPVASSIDPESTEAIEKRVLELQRSQSRYHQIRTRVLSRDVMLTADSNSSAALYEMAQTVARLPGVARVVVREQ